MIKKFEIFNLKLPQTLKLGFGVQFFNISTFTPSLLVAFKDNKLS